MKNDEIVLYVMHIKNREKFSYENKMPELLSFVLCYNDYDKKEEMILGQYNIDSNDNLYLDYNDGNDQEYGIIIFELMKKYGLNFILEGSNIDWKKIEPFYMKGAWQKAHKYIKDKDLEVSIIDEAQNLLAKSEELTEGYLWNQNELLKKQRN